MIERRATERVKTEGQLDGAVMVFQPMTIVDISRGGAQVETPFPLQLDSLHQFRLTLGDLTVVVQGRIAHCRLGELRNEVAVYRSGVEFIELSEHAHRAIAGFVDTLGRSRHAATTERPGAGSATP